VVMAAEFLSDVSFNEQLLSSPYVKPTRMSFTRGGQRIVWDLALSHDHVAIVLFHREKNALLFVKQFRPAIFVGRIRRLPENKNKLFNDVDWSCYPVSLGETIELCAGIVDKDLPLADVAREEIMEECGYSVNVDSIRQISGYVTGIGLEGCSGTLFYAEIDESMRISDGGGNPAEHETIEKVYMTLDEAYAFMTEETFRCTPPGLLVGLNWFFRNHKRN